MYIGLNIVLRQNAVVVHEIRKEGTRHAMDLQPGLHRLFLGEDSVNIKADQSIIEHVQYRWAESIPIAIARVSIPDP